MSSLPGIVEDEPQTKDGGTRPGGSGQAGCAREEKHGQAFYKGSAWADRLIDLGLGRHAPDPDSFFSHLRP